MELTIILRVLVVGLGIPTVVSIAVLSLILTLIPCGITMEQLRLEL